MVGRALPRVEMMLKNGVGTRQISFALMGFFLAPPLPRGYWGKNSQHANCLANTFDWSKLEVMKHFPFPIYYLLLMRQIQKLLDLSWSVKEA